MSRLLTLADVAARLRLESGTSERSVKRLIKKHGTPYRRMGSQWRLSEADFGALVEALRIDPTPSAAIATHVAKNARVPLLAAEARRLLERRLQKRRRRPGP